MSNFTFLIDVGSLPSGQGRTVTIEGRSLAVYNVQGIFYALDDRCPHRGGPLGAGTLQEGKLYCPLHGWGFDLNTGACFDRPDRPVKTYPVRIQNGRVEVCLDAKPESFG